MCMVLRATPSRRAMAFTPVASALCSLLIAAHSSTLIKFPLPVGCCRLGQARVQTAESGGPREGGQFSTVDRGSLLGQRRHPPAAELGQGRVWLRLPSQTVRPSRSEGSSAVRALNWRWEGAPCVAHAIGPIVSQRLRVLAPVSGSPVKSYRWTRLSLSAVH